MLTTGDSMNRLVSFVNSRGANVVGCTAILDRMDPLANWLRNDPALNFVPMIQQTESGALEMNTHFEDLLIGRV